MNTVILHMTREGERWDSLAYQYYGDTGQLFRLIAANGHLPLYECFPSGLKVLIPVIEQSANNEDKMPPWLRK